ncbi:hypothetical protein [Frankia sp. Cas4]|uniref:hypothetical protein n=1 Tax=Frankia sp. Cas4 TaxID=3073927 RepID=UPI002AD39888|nr:hypothetical protein [Frankia sp. Cas4]
MTTPPPPPARTPRLTVCRLHPAGVVLDIPLAAPAGSQVHAGTFWRDPTAPTGWLRGDWQPGPDGRGLRPHLIEPGDVVGFAAFGPAARPPTPALGNPWQPPDRRQQAPEPAVKVAEWWGYIHAIEADALLLHGPHPDAHTAYATAQQTLLARAHQLAATTPPSAGGGGPVPVEPAQAPAAVTATWHGATATIGDPHHGWLHVRTDDLTAAMRLRDSDLRRRLRPHLSTLTGDEAPITLAALAAQHIPDQLPDLLTSPQPAAAETGPRSLNRPGDIPPGAVSPHGHTTGRHPSGPPPSTLDDPDLSGPPTAPSPPLPPFPEGL